jgi:drug/metabolite transporter (DMT)-like permease
MFIFEGFNPDKIVAALGPILFAGVLSCGVAYTLQTVGQKYTEPTVGSLIMSFESFFAVVAESVILWVIPSGREILGCLLMLAAILLSQMQIGGKKKKAKAA